MTHRLVRRLLALLVVLSLSGVIGVPAADAAPPTSFQDLSEDPTLHRGHSEVLRLYFAVLGRTPEIEGAQFWVNAYDSGTWTTRSIAAFFADSPEFRAVYGDLNNADFVRVVYENVLNRPADQEGFNFWVSQVDGGMPRGEMVLLVSNAPEFINRVPLPGDVRPDTGPSKRTTALVLAYFDSIMRLNSGFPDPALAAPNSPAADYAEFAAALLGHRAETGVTVFTPTGRAVTNTSIIYEPNNNTFDNIRVENGRVASYTVGGRLIDDVLGNNTSEVSLAGVTMTSAVGFTESSNSAASFTIVVTGDVPVQIQSQGARWTDSNGTQFTTNDATIQRPLQPGESHTFWAGFNSGGAPGTTFTGGTLTVGLLPANSSVVQDMVITFE